MPNDSRYRLFTVASSHLLRDAPGVVAGALRVQGRGQQVTIFHDAVTGPGTPTARQPGVNFWLPDEEQLRVGTESAWLGGPDAALGLCCSARKLGRLPIFTLHRGKLDRSRAESSVVPRWAMLPRALLQYASKGTGGPSIRDGSGTRSRPGLHWAYTSNRARPTVRGQLGTVSPAMCRHSVSTSSQFQPYRPSTSTQPADHMICLAGPTKCIEIPSNRGPQISLSLSGQNELLT